MGTNTPKKNRAAETAADQKLIDGLTKHAATITALVIGGVTMASKDIIAALGVRITTANAVPPARAAWQAAVAADKAEATKSAALASAVRQALLVAFAGQVDALADFGLSARKPAVLTPAQKAEAIAKAKATRAARHTMGKNQKALITGSSPAGGAPTPATPATVPATAPATPPASPPPATTKS